MGAAIEAHRIESGYYGLYATCYGRAKERALLILSPLAEERKGCQRPLSRLALAVAGISGCSALTFDYAGSGDSPGAFEDITWDSLVGDCTAAFDYLQKQLFIHEISVLAVRSSAPLAMELSRLRDVGEVILWEPVSDPGRWFKEARRRSAFRIKGRPGGDNDLDGYLFSEALVRSMSDYELSLEKRSKITIISVSHRDEPTRESCAMAEAVGAEVRTVRMEPFWLETDTVEPEGLVAATCEIFSAKG